MRHRRLCVCGGCAKKGETSRQQKRGRFEKAGGGNMDGRRVRSGLPPKRLASVKCEAAKVYFCRKAMLTKCNFWPGRTEKAWSFL